jgi:lysophospholipase L1-like esterase
VKRFAIPLALLLGSVALTLAAFEIVLRAIGYSAPIWFEPDPRLGWRMRPGLAAWYTLEGRGFVRANAEGMRDRDHLLDKPAGVYRIAVLGDSYAEARQVEREQAFWALLPGELAACGFQPGKSVEVLNFGVSGYGTAQELLVLQTMAIRYSPDLVLLQFTNGNDVRNNSFALEPEKDRPFFMVGADGALRIDESFASSPGFRARSSFASEALRRVTDRSRLLQLARHVKEHSFIPRAQAAAGVEQGLEPMVLAAPRDAVWEEAWRITEGLIAKTGDFAQRNGARFAVVTVPYAIQVHPDPRVRAGLQAKLGVKDLFYPDQRVAGAAQKSGLLAVPLAPEMQRLAEKSGAYFHGFDQASLGRGHWNAEGHRAAARIIARRLCEARG